MRCALFICALLVAVSRASAGDWPQWRGPARDGHVPASEPVPTGLSEPKVLWHIKVGDGLAAPVVAEGRVLYLDNQGGMETLHALDAKDAKEHWRAEIDKTFTDAQSPPGPRCAPLADGDRVYAQSCKGELRCLKVSDGKEIWQLNYVKDFGALFMGEYGNYSGAARHGNNGSPAIDGEKLIVTVGGSNGNAVVCFQKTTGRVIWKSQDDPAAYAAPIIATIDGVRQVVDFTVLGLIGLDVTNGQLLWRVPLKTASGRHVITPVVAENIVVAGSYETGLVGVNLSRHGTNWQASKAWVSKESAINFSSPVVVCNHLYGLGPAKNFFCVDVKTGAQTWSKQGYLGSGGAGSAHADFMVMGDNVLALTDGGQLVLFAANPKEFKEIGSAQVCGKTWCNPAYADGKLYLRDAHELYCLALMP